MLKYNKKLKPLARGLRKNMTGAEIFLWTKVKGKRLKGAQFYRQKSIGNYIVDFYCPKAKLVIEIDGRQHHEKEGAEKDEVRDKYLESLGLKVLRFTNAEVLKDTNKVIEKIYGEISEKISEEIPPAPLLQRGKLSDPFDKGGSV